MSVLFVIMKKSRFLSPYLKNGKTRFPARAKSGVYIIKNKDGVYLYIGSSDKDVYKTCYRHFQKWSSWQPVVTYAGDIENLLLRVVYCTVKQARALEKKLIWKHSPRDNKYLYEEEELNQDYYQLDTFDKYLETQTVSFEPLKIEWID